MSINVHVKDPRGKDLAKLVHAIAEYIDIEQEISLGIDIEFIKKKKKKVPPK